MLITKGIVKHNKLSV